eukprot:TRINITY_DN465_c0_g1_i5.p1 TRINITY_DN465_c0_g1~~TRINITY_DN465_c0_g1_i5.p1  ORF type:complete len:505 (-),score=95.12 TRINITY_DN465_c0_g1_i5:444-1958(-)
MFTSRLLATGRNLCISQRSFVTSRVLAAEQKGSTKLWGGRFASDTDARVKEWCNSLPCDESLIEVDLWGSMAHVTMLGVQGIISPDAASKILPTLKSFQDNYYSGTLDYYSPQFLNHDDVHMNMEARLIDKVGMDIGGRMHTTRSRNDQVVLDSKLFARKELLSIREKTLLAVKAFLDRAANHTEDVMVGYTHFQHAQPISVAYWLSHYAAVLLRDLTRLKNAYDVCDQNPLGSGALSGTSFPIDRMLTTRLLGFQKVHPHGLDATSSRDFLLDAVSSVAGLQVNLSRLAEELILWSSYEYSTVALDDGFAMGSSMMPQKKNPGSCELLRGRSGRVTGLMTAAYGMMKGLPSGYNRDFHEDKEILIEALTLVSQAIEIIPALVQTTKLKLERMADLTYQNFSTATEVANFLVSKHNIPFREAHHIVGSLVGDLYRLGKNFNDLEFCLNHIIVKHGIKGNFFLPFLLFPTDSILPFSSFFPPLNLLNVSLIFSVHLDLFPPYFAY